MLFLLLFSGSTSFNQRIIGANHKENPTCIFFHPSKLLVSVTGAKITRAITMHLTRMLRYHLLLHALLHTLMLMNSVRGERVSGLCLGGCDYSNGMPLWAEVLYCCLSLLVAWKMRWCLSLWGDTSNWRRITFPSQPSCLSEKASAVNAGSAVWLGEAASPDAGPGTGFDLLLEEAETDPRSQGSGKCDV